MSKLKITNLRAAELGKLCEYKGTMRNLRTGLEQALADRRTLLDALRRAEEFAGLVHGLDGVACICHDDDGTDHSDCLPHTGERLASDLRALLASAEGGNDAR